MSKEATKPNLPMDKEREFLKLAYAGLVLRGYDRERDIDDPILRKVWRFGKKLMLAERPKRKDTAK